MRTLVLPLLVLPLLVACQSGSTAPQAGGVVQPTVAGVPPTRFRSAAEGRAAFLRVSGSVTAILEDASWLLFEGDAACVERNHRAYFEYGYTTFQVELRSKEFTQPTCEEFLLEDSLGCRIPGRPLCFEGSPVLVDDRYFSRFSLSFQHMITRRTQWIRLTRVADGSSVEWQFGKKPCPPAPCAPTPCAPPPACPPPVAPLTFAPPPCSPPPCSPVTQAPMPRVPGPCAPPSPTFARPPGPPAPPPPPVVR